MISRLLNWDSVICPIQMIPFSYRSEQARQETAHLCKSELRPTLQITAVIFPAAEIDEPSPCRKTCNTYKLTQRIHLQFST